MFDSEQFKRAFPKGRKIKKLTEAKLQLMVCKYIRAQYPSVRFISSLTGEYQSSRTVRARNSAIQWGRGQPDLMIMVSRHPYCGLAIEIKTLENTPYLEADGGLKKDEHLVDQLGWLVYMGKMGWKADFGVGFDEIKEMIDQYLSK